MISHQPFFEFLATTAEDSPAWHPVVAGLAVLRMIDSRIDRNGLGEIDWESLESLNNTAREISEGDPVRAILLQLIESARGTEIRRDALGRGLLGFGRALDFDGRWALACDVYATADKVAGPRNGARISIESNIALAVASRRLGDWDASEHAYARASYLATAVADTAAALMVEVGRANTHIQRGNLPVAQSMLEELIPRARTDGANDVLGQALLSRASLAHLRREYGDAVRIGYEALETTTNLTTRDTILSDIAAAFAGLGLRESARDGYLIVAGTAQSQWVRWQATMNLMELAGLDDRESDFDAYARELEAAPLAPWLRAYYFMLLSAGQQTFGREADAERSLANGLEVAEKNQLHQVAHEASVAMKELKSRERRRRQTTTAPKEIDASLRRIASELSSLREAATSSP